MGAQHGARFVEGFRYEDGPGAEFGVQQRQTQQQYEEQAYKESNYAYFH
jgi:hypothetical protein